MPDRLHVTALNDPIDDRGGEAPSRRGAFFGRRKGHRLRATQAELMANALPARALDLDQPAPADLATLFPCPVRAVRVEIGFGGGEHLLHEADANPDVGFIGVEPFVNGMAKMLAALAAAPRPNIRLVHADALGLLPWLPEGSVAGIDLLYPDPWPKKRHWKRRFVSDDTVALMARAIRPGGLFRFASDIDSYVEWTLVHLRRAPQFEWTAERADDWRRPWAGWPSTRYEAKAIAAGRQPAYLVFRRRAPAVSG
ncbi:tRNA (guanine-N(7)-)-methyltransferase [Blastochloris tepida]|uniref:tRNA (guanine-N(7)-)-methyltransferase n=1 Tax=Blastochloris tepida TaxID=2233851 RepID=A0A348G2M8_9HYPH|nr:tRNA (guanine-N(7)-)-methyltransferase [Blastochloris tepida]